MYNAKSLALWALMALFVLISVNVYGQVEGKFSGTIVVAPGQNLEFIANFTTEAGKLKAAIDIPSQGLKNYELSDLSFLNDSIKITLKNPTNNAYFRGKFVTKDSVSGEFQQAVYNLAFYMLRGVKVDNEVLPYKAEEVSFTNGNNYFAGTLTLPPYPGKHPAVVLITGSGPQTRDEEIVGFKIFKVIADHFTKNGIAVLRYDDRNVGDSKGTPVDSSTTADFADDVVEAVKYLKTRDDINPEQIGLMGHSEGGIIAPMAAVKDPSIAFIVLMAGTSVTGKEIILDQTARIMRASGVDENEILENRNVTAMMIDATLGNISWESVMPVFREYYLKSYSKLSDEAKKDVDSAAFMKEMDVNVLKAFGSNWMKYFLTYDPQPMLKQVRCPALVLFGEKDMQVSTAINLEPMQNALKESGNKLYTIKIFDSANHLFQQAETGAPIEYSTLKKQFVPGFLEYITAWMLGFVTPSK